MNALSSNPSNINFLSQVGFRFDIGRSPNFNYFIQKVDFPGVSLQSVDMPNPFVKAPLTGEHLDYDKLKITFKLDEDLRGYFEMYDWMVALGKPENFDQSSVIYNKKRYDEHAVYSDGSLVILNASMNPNVTINFYDMLPVYLSGFTLETDTNDIQFISASMTFVYRMYKYEYIGAGYTDPYNP